MLFRGVQHASTPLGGLGSLGNGACLGTCGLRCGMEINPHPPPVPRSDVGRTRAMVGRHVMARAHLLLKSKMRLVALLDCWGMLRGLIRSLWVSPRQTRMTEGEDRWSEACHGCESNVVGA